MEGKRKQQACASHGHQESDNAASYCEQDAFRESLRNNLPRAGAESQAHCGLSAARYGASQ